MTILHRAAALPAVLVNEEDAVLTLALATIVVLTVASLALMLWPEPPPPELLSDGEPEAEESRVAADDDERPVTPQADV